MAYEDYGVDPMGNYTGYVDQEAEAIAQREEEERKRKEAEERARKEQERIDKERDNLAVHKQEVTTYANGSKTITNVAEIPATPNAPGRPTGPVAPTGFQGQTDEFGGVDQAIEKQRQMQEREAQQAQRRSDQQAQQAAQGPVNPADVWQRQIQAESGGNHIDPRTGQVITSNKGAMGIAQIMPRTAMQPGYGIPDIFTLAKQNGVSFNDRSEASAKQLLANPDLNMQFGQNYKNAMLNHFGGDEEKATASYNAGVGGVNKAVQRAQQMGGDWKDHLPNETKGYLQKIFGGQQAQQAQPVIPGPAYPEAGAGRGNAQRPMAPVAPDDSIINNQVADFERRQAEQGQAPSGEAPAPAPQGPVSPYSLATGTGAPGIKVPGMKPTGVESSEAGIKAYQDNQNDPMSLLKLGSSDDPSIPDWIKERSRNRFADLVTQEREMNKAKEVVANSSETDLAKYLRKKTEGGSYLKLFMYNMLGMDKSAAEESAKLGMGDEKLATTSDGRPALIKYGINGTPIEGYDASTGKKLTAEQLVGSSPRVKPNAKDESLATARTQASHAFTAKMTSLTKERDKFIENGGSPADLKARGLDDETIQRKATAASDAVMNDAKRFLNAKDTGGEDLSRTRPAASPVNPAAVAPVKTISGKAEVVETPEAQVTKTSADDTFKDSKILANWSAFRPNESVANKQRRTQFSADDVDRQAQLLISGDMLPEKITGRDAGIMRANAVARAKELDPTYSPVDAGMRVDALKKWTNPDSQISKQVRAHITAANSIEDVKMAFEALQNKNLPLFNQIKNSFEKNTGKALPISAETGAMLLGPEIIKSIIPNGGGVAERLEAKHLLGTKLSPAQAKAVFEELETFQGNSLKAMETDWTRAKLPKGQFRERVLDGSPAAQELYDRASKHQAERAALKAGLPAAPSKADIEAEMRKRGLLK